MILMSEVKVCWLLQSRLKWVNSTIDITMKNALETIKRKYPVCGSSLGENALLMVSGWTASS